MAEENWFVIPEEKWLTSTDPDPMWVYLHYSKASRRKLGLWACACVRRIEHLINDERSRLALRLAEKEYDDQSIDDEIWEKTKRDAHTALGNVPATSVQLEGRVLVRDPYPACWAAYQTMEGDWQCCQSAAYALALFNTPKDSPEFSKVQEKELGAQSDLLRCIFGNPFRPVTVKPAWLTATVVSLPHGIYDDRAFDRLPILADALEDAGCDNADILNHCRQPREHVRGCWVVDLRLGKQ